MKKIVVRFKDGSMLKGTSSNFTPHRKVFHINVDGGSLKQVEMEELKAVFFVKDYEGDKDHRKVYKDFRPWEGNKIKVIFNDGEEITGFTPHLAIDKKGFFMVPADLKSNNEKIFVITSATKEIVFL